MRQQRERLGVIAVCIGLSILVHVAELYGLQRWWSSEKSPADEPEERVTILRLEEEDEPPEPPPPEPESPKPEPPKPEPPKPEIELEELEEPEPEEEPEKPEEPEPESEQPPPELIREQLKSVEQPDELDEPDAPEDANYLSNVNRDVTEETRSEITNLEQDAVEPEVSSTEPSEADEPGTADETEIAQQEQLESQVNRLAPDTTPQAEEQRPEQNDPKPLSFVAMRELEHRDHQMAQLEQEALAEQAEDGELAAEQDQQASLSPQDRQARIEKNDQKYAFRHKENDLVALFGRDLAARPRAESKHQSKRKGVWEDQRKHYQSPLENMVPEVQPGNQTALRSRKHPFARYIAQMHRKIHDAWAWNFLEQLDARGRNHPLNDYDLWTQVEIVLNGDGSIDKVITIRHSGSSVFDAAAREHVWSAGPYPNPPREILSGNGKVYMHWAFHRDNRACGTFGAQPFILDKNGEGDRPDPNIPVRAGRAEQLERRLGRRPAPKVAEGPAPPPSARRQPSASHEHDHEHGDGHEHGAPSVSERNERPTAGGRESTDPQALSADPEAKKAADQWLYFFTHDRADKVVSRSSIPFYSGDRVVARTREDLKTIVSALMDEAAGKTAKAAKIYTASRLAREFGSVPAGVHAGTERIYGVSRIGSEYFILLLERRFESWRVVGFTR